MLKGEIGKLEMPVLLSELLQTSLFEGYKGFVE